MFVDITALPKKEKKVEPSLGLEAPKDHWHRLKKSQKKKVDNLMCLGNTDIEVFLIPHTKHKSYAHNNHKNEAMLIKWKRDGKQFSTTVSA